MAGIRSLPKLVVSDTAMRLFFFAFLVLLIVSGLSGGSALGPAHAQEPSPSDVRSRASAVVLDVFLRALDDPDRGVRCAAAMALETAGPAGAFAIPVLAQRLDDPEWCVPMPSAPALAAFGDEAIGELASALGRDGSRERRLAAVAGLAWAGPAGLVALRPAFLDPDAILRREACLRAGRAASGDLPEEVVSGFRSLLESSDPEVGRAAAIDLAYLGRGDVGANVLVEAILESVLRGPDRGAHSRVECPAPGGLR